MHSGHKIKYTNIRSNPSAVTTGSTDMHVCKMWTGFLGGLGVSLYLQFFVFERLLEVFISLGTLTNTNGTVFFLLVVFQKFESSSAKSYCKLLT